MEWARIARSQAGVVSRSQLRSTGITKSGITRMLAAGAINRVSSGVYLARGAPLTYLAELWTAVLATDGVLGFATAAHLWGTIEIRPDRVHVVVAHSRRVYPPSWVRLHRVAVPPEVRTTQRGLPITSRTWTLLDYLPTLPRADASRLADRSIQRQWMATRDIERRLRHYPGRTGNRRLRELITQTGDGAAALSERKLHALLRGHGITEWVPNYPVWAHGELVGVLDIAFPKRRIAVEIDGWAYHSDVDRFRRDRSRQNALVGQGWTVLRFTWADLVERPGYVAATIGRLLAA